MWRLGGTWGWGGRNVRACGACDICRVFHTLGSSNANNPTFRPDSSGRHVGLKLFRPLADSSSHKPARSKGVTSKSKRWRRLNVAAHPRWCEFAIRPYFVRAWAFRLVAYIKFLTIHESFDKTIENAGCQNTRLFAPSPAVPRYDRKVAHCLILYITFAKMQSGSHKLFTYSN